MKSSQVRLIYRHLMRIARIYDRFPRFKALLVNAGAQRGGEKDYLETVKRFCVVAPESDTDRPAVVMTPFIGLAATPSSEEMTALHSPAHRVHVREQWLRANLDPFNLDEIPARVTEFVRAEMFGLSAEYYVPTCSFVDLVKEWFRIPLDFVSSSYRDDLESRLLDSAFRLMSGDLTSIPIRVGLLTPQLRPTFDLVEDRRRLEEGLRSSMVAPGSVSVRASSRSLPDFSAGSLLICHPMNHFIKPASDSFLGKVCLLTIVNQTDEEGPQGGGIVRGVNVNGSNAVVSGLPLRQGGPVSEVFFLRESAGLPLQLERDEEEEEDKGEATDRTEEGGEVAQEHKEEEGPADEDDGVLGRLISRARVEFDSVGPASVDERTLTFGQAHKLFDKIAEDVVGKGLVKEYPGITQVMYQLCAFKFMGEARAEERVSDVLEHFLDPGLKRTIKASCGSISSMVQQLSQGPEQPVNVDAETGERLALFYGMAGWGYNQLVAELLAGWWFHVKLDSESVRCLFNLHSEKDCEDFYWDCVRALGGEFQDIAQLRFAVEDWHRKIACEKTQRPQPPTH